ncbi:UNVERIFIED_CONTAM: LLM class flavin-dependent oxidoreductase, partial [Bacteroidetes bacterium 56_B9]
YISGGRLEIGVASGVPPEFLFVNVPQDDVRPMYQESVEFLDKALQGRLVTHEGRFWKFTELPVMPQTKRVARRRKWMTIYSDASCRNA